MMFRIEYKIISDYFGEIEELTDEEIQYNFLLGNVSFLSSDLALEMEWEWIPLLDFSYCLRVIARNITDNEKGDECFEFTENAETLKFSTEAEQLKISFSFSSAVITTTVKDFVIATDDFHLSVSKYVRESVLSKDPPQSLQKYLSI
jgi:hypothetical protein